jgi:hypothetical protein
MFNRPPETIMGRFIACLVCLGSASLASAQDGEVDIPSAAPVDFSQVAGKKFEITTSAAPTEVFVEEPITLKVTIIGAGPEKYRPQRNNLKIFPDDFTDDFHLEAVPDQDKHTPEKGPWEFTYRVRPKRVGVAHIPGLHLSYFETGANKFTSSFSDEIPIKVTRRQEATAEKLNLKIIQAPARFYELRPVDQVLRDDTPVPPPGPELFAALLTAPPVLSFVWYRFWRRLYPNAAERRQRRRSRAARLALAYLTRQAPDVARTRAAAVDFLRQRLDLPALEATPSEVARHLKRLGIAKPLIADWAAFLQSCDRYRFAPSVAEPEGPVNAEAIRLIHAVEADSCAAR